MAERLHRLTVAICGAAHSGSTLLGLVLGGHSDCFYAGELEKIRYVGRPDAPLRKRGCKICGEGCPVWSRFVQPASPDLYEAIARLSDRRTIVDSTKRVPWIEARAAELDGLGVPHKLLFIGRDGRAVVNSRVRKYGAEQAEAHVARWLEQIAATEALIGARGEENTLRLRYEELVTEPERQTRRVCTFLGLPYEPRMLDYAAHEQHPIGGNAGTESVVARRARGHDGVAGVPERSRGYYERLTGFVLDRRWTTELPPDILRLFEERAGVINEPYRWDV